MNSAPKKISCFFFDSVYTRYWKTLEKEINGSQTLLDLGCGPHSPIANFRTGLRYSLGIDIFAPSIKTSKEKSIHSGYVCLDIVRIKNAIKSKSFDCVLASDVLEHLPKAEGFEFISAIEKIAKKKVILFTPNGFIQQNGYDENRHQRHLSGWNIGEMKALGYQVIGINGWKGFFGLNDDIAEVIWKPKILWRKIAFLSQILTQRFPQYAFQLLYLKKIATSN